MAKKDKSIGDYIGKSAEFAIPVLEHFRNLIHMACPDVEEKIKWGFPHFDYKGEMMCSMAAFKNHCAFSFWKAALMKDAQKLMDSNKEAMGNYGKITSLKDLPGDKIIQTNIREAMKLNEAGIKLPQSKKFSKTSEIILKEEFKQSLNKNRKALIVFEAFSPSHKKEYVEWINEAKTEVTINKRITQTIEWLIEGKSRNWKYVKK